MTKRRPWQSEYDVAAIVLAGEPGSLEWASDNHVAFRYRENGTTIVFYPHKTSAGNYHLRVRSEGKATKRFTELAARLYIGAGLSCTFQTKHGGIPTLPDGSQWGWAAKQAGHPWI